MRDIYLTKKQANKKFSLQYFANKMGFSSRGNLKMIMDGKSNISAAAIKRLNEALEHNKAQADFFQLSLAVSSCRNVVTRSLTHSSRLQSPNNSVMSTAKFVLIEST
jgi:uncharacterized protein (TIGR02147 family)